MEDEPDGRAGFAWKATGSGNWLGFDFSVLRSGNMKPPWRWPSIRNRVSPLGQGVGSSVFRWGMCPAGAGAGFEHLYGTARARWVGTTTFRQRDLV